MNDLTALLAAIITNPDEDTPRLAYADELEARAGSVPCTVCPPDEGEDPHPADIRCDACSGSRRVPDGRRGRAEFIRVQCELGKLGPPHKRTWHPEQPTALTPHGDRHYSFCGYVDEGLAVGDRIDLLVHRPLRKPKTVHGFRVYKISPHPEPYSRGELKVFVRLDKDSAPWPGEAIRRREGELWDAVRPGIIASLPDGWGATLADPVSVVYRDGTGFATVARGFVHGLTCTAAVFLAHADSLVWHPTQTVACPEKCQPRMIGDPKTYKSVAGTNLVVLCRGCSGEGRVPRPCPETAQPVRAVTLTRVSWTDHTALGERWHAAHPLDPKIHIMKPVTELAGEIWPGVTFHLSPDASWATSPATPVDDIRAVIERAWEGYLPPR